MRKLIKLVFILAVFPIFSTLADDLPDLGSSSAAIITPAKEKQLGEMFMREIRRQVAILNDPLVNDYISGVGFKLVSNADEHRVNFHFLVVDDPDINAFTGPAGYVAVNSGIFTLTKNESELASVMAHEIGHAVQHHIARAIARQQELAVPNAAALLAAIALGIFIPDAAIGALGAVSAGNLSSSLSFSRSNEKEADRMGMQILSQAGFDPYAMPNFLKNMQSYALDFGDRIPTYLRTHPQTADRIADTENRAKQYQRKAHYKNSEMFYLIKARVYVITAQNSGEAVSYFQQLLNGRSKQNLIANQYGYALALDRGNKFDKAREIMADLAAKYPSNPIFQMGLAEVDTDSGNNKAAVDELNKIIDLYPDYYPLIVQCAYALIKASRFQQAESFIRKEQLQFPNDANLYKLLSEAEGQLGKLADAYQARARYFELVGNKQMAIIQLKQAQNLPNLSYEDRAEINAKLSTLKP